MRYQNPVLAVDYVLGLGSNLGSRRANIEAGLALLAATAGCRVEVVSALYESEPVGPPQPHYLNGAARVSCELPPSLLLERLLAIEAQLGRDAAQRRVRWGARTLDLDILWAARAHDDARLSIPHPRLRERWFALAPLLEVAPHLQAEYGECLRALLSVHAPLGPRVAPPAIATVHAGAQGRAFTVSATASDTPEAAAAALTALGRALASAEPEYGKTECGKTEARVLLGECESGQEFEALLRRSLALFASGFSWQRAALCALSPGRYDARVVGTASAPTDLWCANAVVTRERSPGTSCVEFAVEA